MAMDAAPALKRRGAEAPELWMADGVPATKIRRLDAEVPPVVPGVAAPPPMQQQQQQQPVVDLEAAVLKRKVAEAPELWLDDGGGYGFPISSRATKIRRLDAEVPPVVPGVAVPPPPMMPQQQPLPDLEVAEVPVVVAAAPNEERAIVLYKPADAARNLLLGPLRPEVPLRVSPDWIHSLRSTLLREGSDHRALFEQLAREDSSNLAMVPWVASSSQESAASTAAPVTEMMDAEEGTEGASMEVEQDVVGPHHCATAGAAHGEAMIHHQWPQQQQHCIVQQEPLTLPPTSYQPSPVTWSW